jgi:hypothetical protein
MFRRHHAKTPHYLFKTLRYKNREPFSHGVPVGEAFKKEATVLLECKATLWIPKNQ